MSGEVSLDMLSEVESISCNLCGSRDSQQLFVKGGLAIARCTHCGLVFSNPRLAQAEIWKRYSPTYFWDEYMPAHLAPNGEYAAEWHRRRNQPFLDLLDRYRPQGQGSLLEIGCAAGFFLKVAEENGWSVTGVEIMSDAVRFARESLDLDVVEGTLEQARLPAESFDAVVLIETVEHLLDPAATLAEVYRVLRAGGVVCITVPNLNSIMLPLLGLAWSVLSPAEHLFYFTEETLARLLDNHGFENISFTWSVNEQNPVEMMCPLNTHNPDGLRSRLVKWFVLAAGRFVAPLVIRGHRTDRLIAVAAKPNNRAL